MAQRPTDEPDPNREVPLKGRPKPSQTARDEQRRDALRVANEVRAVHRQLKQELGSLPIMESRGMAAHVLLTDRERFGAMELVALLRGINYWAHEKARRFCQKAGVNERTRLKDLGDEEAEHIAAMLSNGQTF